MLRGLKGNLKIFALFFSIYKSLEKPSKSDGVKGARTASIANRDEPRVREGQSWVRKPTADQADRIDLTH